MSKLAIIGALLMLAGCAHAPTGLATASRLPELPPALATKAKRLPPITDRTLAGTVKDAVSTDQRYGVVARQLNALIDVYECVRESLNDNRDASACLKR